MKTAFRFFFLSLALGAASCRGPAADHSASGSDGDGGAATVAVAKVTRENLAKSVELTAEFLPWQEVEIHAKVAGYVKEMNVDVGDHAKEGQVLATLEIPEIEDEERQADAAVATAQEQVKSLEAAYEETSLLAGRMTAAAKETQGLIAQQDLDTANAKNRSTEADLAAARQKVVEAQANAAHLKDLVAYSKITAPFDGVVTRRYADTGALVQAGTVQAGTAAGSNSMPLVSFAEMKRLRLEFPVPESEAASIHLGDPVEIDVSSLRRIFSGKVSRFAQKVDAATRTMLTEVDIDNPDYVLLPGIYATVRLTLAQKKNVLAVPIQCVEAGENPFVLVVKDNKIEKRPVTLGLETPDRAEILSGLDEDDLVVVGNRSSLQPGQTVTTKTIASR